MRSGRTRLTLFAALASYLSTVALWPLLETQRWPYLALLVVIVMAASGWLCRWARVPAPLTPIVHAIVLLVLLTVVFTRSTAVAGVLPTPASLGSMHDLIVSALIDVRRFATPAPETSGLMLLTVGGIGIVAFLVDFIAVRLRRPGGAGLPMLALFSVAAGVLRDGPGWLAFLLGSAGFLGLLLSDNSERLQQWGRPVLVRRPGERGPRRLVHQTADTATVASLGRRIGVAAVLVAVVVPAFVPLADRSFSGGNGPGNSWLDRFGAPTLQAPDPVVSMRRDLLRESDAVLFTYTSSSRNPDYLRTVALTDFDGTQWTAGKLRGFDQYSVKPGFNLSLPTGSDPSILTTVRTDVRAERDVALNFLPAPYAPKEIRADGSWYYDPSTLTVFDPKNPLHGLHYTVVSDVPHPRPTQLDIASDPGVIVRPYLELPSDLPAEVRTTARDVTKDATTRYRKALALQDWFTELGGFSYSTDVRGSSTDALLQFLHDRRGYCEQFAGAMAIMARALGIPSRVAVGFTQGTRDGDRWVVRGRDAHAWPELWFEDVGWVRFEPTPAGFGGQASAEVPGYSRSDALNQGNNTNQTGEATDVPTGAAGGASTAASVRHRELDNSAQAVAGGGGNGIGASGWFSLLGVAILLVLLLFTPALVRRIIRLRRWSRARDPADLAHAAWAELRDDATDIGVPLRHSETPRSAGGRLADRLAPESAGAEAVRRIALAEERACYAPAPGPAENLRSDVGAARTALAHGLSRAKRTRALLFPRSVLDRVRVSTRGDRDDAASGPRSGP
jgi:transglutaminase-like putative cysteine protease